jgi:outer membrane biosynthesis protein TonB
MAKQESVARKQSGSERDTHGTAQNGDEDDVARYEKELAGYLQERIKPRLNSGAIPLLARSIAKEIAHWDAPNGASKATDDEPSAEADDEPDAEAEEEPDAEAEEEPDAEAGDEPDAEADEEPDAEAEDEPDAETEEEPEAESDEEPEAESADEPSAESDDEPSADGDAQQSDFEADMHELQAELGEDWILSFSVQGDDGWLTAQKDDGSQRVEAPTAAVLTEAVGLLNEGGGRSA